MNNVQDDQFAVLVTRSLKLRRASGDELIDVVIEIGQPYWTEKDVEAACPVAIRGTVGRVNDIRGIDPMSAIKQAIAFAEAYLDQPEGEAKFFWPSGEEY